jgi:mannose-1-phosphate guanylyltransferase
MAGGAGERFWPLSRQHYPKQLLKIAGNRSMLRAAVERVRSLVPPEQVYVITSRMLKPAIEIAAEELPPGNIIAEPEGKNTAACLALACSFVRHRFPDEPDVTMIVLTADHFIHDTQAFSEDCAEAVAHAEKHNSLVTFGIMPDRPETGYGYIELGEADPDSPRIFRVGAFREKPDPETAKHFQESGRFLWNSGMFVWRTGALCEAFREHLPGTWKQIDAMRDAFGAADPEEALAAAFEPIEKISIDVGVLERARNVSVVKASFDWDDIGTWGSLSRLLARDASGNVAFGNSVLLRSENSIAYSITNGDGTADGPIVIGLGLKDTIIVHTRDAVLVLPAGEAQKVKDVVAYLREHGLTQYL